MSFGKNLASIRKEKGLTQEDLVQKSGVAISQIRRYETDKSSPTLDVIMKLAVTLGVSIDELAFDKGHGIAENKIMDRELLEKFEIISNMKADAREIVKKILEGVIMKYQIEKIMKPAPEKPWAQRFKEVTNRLAQGAKDYSQDQIDKVIDEVVAEVREKEHAKI